MSTNTFTEEECEALHAAPKYIASELKWEPGDVPNVMLFKAQVFTTDGKHGLLLVGHWQRNVTHGQVRWGFSLDYMGNCVRHYDMAKRHWNATGDRVRGPHKHRFKSSKMERYAYKPDPPISVSDPNQALIDFLVEENIQVPDNYQFFMFPTT